MQFSSEHLWYLVSLKLSGEAGQEQLAELDELLKANPEAVFQVEVLERLWQQRKSLPAQQVSDAYSRHLQRLSNHLSEPVLKYADPEPDAEPVAEAPVRSIKRWWWMGGVAATVLMGVLLYFFRTETKADNPPSQNVVSTRPGSKSKVQLPDGTVVWLNSGSRLTYNESADGRLREAQLSGEAYFEVAKDKKRPFIIHTGTIDVKVLGTAFNLRAYPDEKTTETALIHGSVEIKLLSNPDQKFVLKPNEKLVVKNKKTADDEKPAVLVPLITFSRVQSLEQDSGLLETSWINNKLAFDGERLDEIARKLERWYDVRVTITDDVLKETAYSGVFEGEGLEDVLKALKLTGNFNYSISNKEVRISP